MPKQYIILIILFIVQIVSTAQPASIDSLLSPDEHAWLRNNKDKIRFAPNPSWPPADFIDNDGTHKGIVADYIRVFEQKLGITFQKAIFKNWPGVIDGLKNNEADFVGGIHKTNERLQYLNITDPFLVLPTGIVINAMHSDKFTEKDIAHMRLACPKKYASTLYIKNIYPKAQIIESEDDFSSLLLVSFGNADGAVIDLITASYLVDKYGVLNLKLLKTLDFKWEIGIGVTKNHPELYSILNKTLNSISTEEREAIYKKWVDIKMMHSQSFFEKHQMLIFYILIVFIVIILLVISINRTLNRKVKERTFELKNLINKLIKNEEKYRLLVENQSDLIIKLDMNGRFMFVSNSFCKVFGKTEDELLNQTFDPLVHPDDVQYTYKMINSVKNPPHIIILEIRVNTIMGLRWYEWTGKALFNSNNQVIGLISTGRDITDKKEFETELIKAKEQAEESDRLKTAFLANMSHEIRTPLNSIMGFASLLPDETDKDLINQYSNIIYLNSDFLVHIIDDIVLYSQLQAKSFGITPQKINACRLFNDIEQLYNLPKYQDKISFNFDNTIDCKITLYTDYEKLKQIFSNLIGNALKYTFYGLVTVGAYIENNNIVFYIKDTGIGIPENETHRVFERFFRGSNTFKETIPGTGLGLSIVKELIDLLGGKIWFETEEEKGSTFFFSLKYFEE